MIYHLIDNCWHILKRWFSATNYLLPLTFCIASDSMDSSFRLPILLWLILVTEVIALASSCMLGCRIQWLVGDPEISMTHKFVVSIIDSVEYMSFGHHRVVEALF